MAKKHNKNQNDLDIKYISTEKLVPYANNARTHSDEQIRQIADSIGEFGFTNPVLIDEKNGVIAGHGRIMAAQLLKLDTIPTIKLSGLSEAQKKAYVIVDNKLAENSGWDLDLLRSEFIDLQDMDFDTDLLGFSDEDMLEIFPEEPKSGLTDEDDVPEPPEEPKTKLGDVYILGDHRLMCGDSTKIEDVEKLMDGQKADMVFTDPPYNIDYQGVKDKRDKIKNDKMSEEDFLSFLTSSLMSCEVMYVCCSWQYSHIFKKAMDLISRKPKAMIVWDKVNPAQHLDKYFKQHEIIYYYGDFGGNKTLRGDVWQLKRQRNELHPTMKPVELIEMAINDQLGKKIIYDGFGGSGSTMIACEKTSRHARLMELDPKYCDVIVKRWEDYTGQKAELIS